MRPRVRLSVDENGACLEFRNARGKLIAELAEAPDDSGQIMGSISADHHFGFLTIHGTLGSPAVSLTATDEGGHHFLQCGREVKKARMQATLPTCSAVSAGIQAFAPG